MAFQGRSSNASARRECARRIAAGRRGDSVATYFRVSGGIVVGHAVVAPGMDRSNGASSYLSLFSGLDSGMICWVRSLHGPPSLGFIFK